MCLTFIVVTDDRCFSFGWETAARTLVPVPDISSQHLWNSGFISRIRTIHPTKRFVQWSSLGTVENHGILWKNQEKLDKNTALKYNVVLLQHIAKSLSSSSKLRHNLGLSSSYFDWKFLYLRKNLCSYQWPIFYFVTVHGNDNSFLHNGWIERLTNKIIIMLTKSSHFNLI